MEALSSATIRNVMADLEDEGYLYQPHTSAGRVPTAAAYRFFAQQVAAAGDVEPGRRGLDPRANLPRRLPQRKLPSAPGTCWRRFRAGWGLSFRLRLPRRCSNNAVRSSARRARRGGSGFDGRNTRDKIIRPERAFSQADLDRTADYLNRHYVGPHARSHSRGSCSPVWRRSRSATTFWPAMRWPCATRKCWSKARRSACTSKAPRRWPAAPEFADQAQLREVLVAIEEKHKLIALLAGCIDTPDPVHVQIGVKGIDPAGEHLALISAPYSFQDQSQGTVGVLGPMRMHYERAITAVAFVARAFSETLDRS